MLCLGRAVRDQREKVDLQLVYLREGLGTILTSEIQLGEKRGHLKQRDFFMYC